MTDNAASSPTETGTAKDVADLVESVGDQLIEALRGDRDPCLIGIQRRGDVIANRLQTRLQDALDLDIPLGSLDITIYRDDFDSLTEAPVVGKTDITFTVDDRTVVLVDDVLYTGRTIRAALEEILEFGRPTRILLVTMVDRGWRELPIQPDIVGTRLETDREDNVQILVEEVVGEDAIRVTRSGSQGSK